VELYETLNMSFALCEANRAEDHSWVPL